MLVLSRRVGESVGVGDDIVATVLEVRGDVVRVGVDAPRSVQVSRQELLTALAETNRAAASPAPRPQRTPSQPLELVEQPQPVESASAQG